jgi:hypothetical protein
LTAVLYLVDREEVVEEVEYWPRPDFYSQSTANGTPLKYIVSARPKRLSIFPYRYCHFWNEGEGCLFCDIVPQLKKARTELGVPTRAKPEEIGFAVGEALKEPGRFTGICITGGSILSGTEAFDDEVDYYIEVLKAIGANFRDNQFPSQLIATAFSEIQLQRLHDETGLMSYTADIEVLDERLFGWICPGKARQIGYQEWKHRLVRAAEIFGRASRHGNRGRSRTRQTSWIHLRGRGVQACYGGGGGSGFARRQYRLHDLVATSRNCARWAEECFLGLLHPARSRVSQAAPALWLEARVRRFPELREPSGFGPCACVDERNAA